MTAWLCDRTPADARDWVAASAATYSEEELTYLYNDIGPLFYVLNTSVGEMAEDVLI